jgi:hypothetical protein
MERQIGDAEYQLTVARALISTPEKWCQRGFKRGEAFCASGTLRELQPRFDPYVYYQDSRAFRLLAQETTKKGFTVIGFNDYHTHGEVLAVFDAAIAEARRLGV